MSHFELTGGVPLHGEVRAGGAKNAALPIMAAAILASEPVHLGNVPRVEDMRTQSRVLEHLGLSVVEIPGAPAEASERGLTLTTVDAAPIAAPEEPVRRMRASFCVLGPLLARRGKARVPLPGGCNIGHRPVDRHLKGLAALGADIRLEHGYVVAESRRLRAAEIDLAGPNGPTVTGTANLLMAAALARGVTILHGAAVEPEIVDLGRFLTALGAQIEGLGTSTLRIMGVEQLGGATHRLIPDRIETATLLMAVAITGGAATVRGAAAEHLGAVLEKLRAAGVEIAVQADRISLDARGVADGRRLRAVDIIAEPYPAMPTDLQAQWTTVCCLAEGVSRIEDRVFPARFLHVAELHRLGAKIAHGGGVATVTGVDRLSGARVTASDLRASAAMVLAGLAAEGRTVVDRIHHLDRGYERLDEKLRLLGARIERLDAGD